MDGGASMHAKLKLLQSWITRMARRRGGCLNCAATSATVLQIEMHPQHDGMEYVAMNDLC